MKFPAIYLASQSPRRQELLRQIGVDFSVIKAEVDETIREQEAPLDYVQRIAIEKVQAGVALHGDRPVLAADTAVVLGEEVFGKPENAAHARHMLQQLSGRTHQVMTAVAVAAGQQVNCTVSISDVTFAKLSPAQIDWYLQTGEGADKAGSYAVQGLAALFIELIHGSYSGIMGLPIRETGQLLMQMESRSEQ